MTFAEAMQLILDGKHVTRPKWSDSELSIHIPALKSRSGKVLDCDCRTPKFTRDDLESTDWIECLPYWERSGDD